MTEMRYMNIEGGKLVAAERPIPQPGPDEVLIRVAAAGVNHADIFQVAGKYPPPEGAPEWPGLEVSGTVEAVGEGVREWKAGMRVMALLEGGGYASHAIARAGSILPVPDGLELKQAAALPEALFTCWLALIETGGMRPGETVLIHGGSSGIGSMAIQLAKWRGCRVLTTARSAEKLEYCRKLGADVLINYRERDFVEVARAETGEKGVDLILDMVGGEYIRRGFAALAVEGRIVSLAFLQGREITLNAGPLLLRRLSWQGVTLRAQPASVKRRIRDALRQSLLPEIVDGRVHMPVDKFFPLTESGNALAYMEESLHCGKILLET